MAIFFLLVIFPLQKAKCKGCTHSVSVSIAPCIFGCCLLWSPMRRSCTLHSAFLWCMDLKSLGRREILPWIFLVYLESILRSSLEGQRWVDVLLLLFFSLKSQVPSWRNNPRRSWLALQNLLSGQCLKTSQSVRVPMTRRVSWDGGFLSERKITTESLVQQNSPRGRWR